MTQSKISPETMAFLQQYGEDLPSAIAAAPDAELQQISPTYRELRQTMDEGAVKREMLGDQGAQQPEPTPGRAGMLEQMLSVATDPGLRELIENELQTERVIQEHLQLMQMADGAGDDDLADEIGRRLRALMDMSDDEPEPDLMEQAETLPPDPASAEPEAPAEAPAETPAAVTEEPDAAVLADRLKAAWGAKGAGQQAEIPAVATDADYDALPSGAEFADPEGNIRRKP